MSRAYELIRTATRLIARHGDEAAVRYARSRAEAAEDDPMASATWEQVAHTITVIAAFEGGRTGRKAA